MAAIASFSVAYKNGQCKRRGRDAMARAPDCLASHACSRFRTPLFPCGVFRERERTMLLPSQCLNGGLVELRLKPVYRRYFRAGLRRSCNIREVLIFENFARRTNSRVQESRENYYYYNSATVIEVENSRILDFEKSPKITNLRKSKHAKITRSTVYQVSSTIVNSKKKLKI